MRNVEGLLIFNENTKRYTVVVYEDNAEKYNAMFKYLSEQMHILFSSEIANIIDYITYDCLYKIEDLTEYDLDVTISTEKDIIHIINWNSGFVIRL